EWRYRDPIVPAETITLLISQSGFARNHRTDNIADRQCLRSSGLGFALRCDGIRRLAGLRNQKRDGLRGNDRIAVTPFTGVVHFHRKTRHSLDHKLAGLGSMPTGATCGDVDLLCSLELGFSYLHFIKKYMPSFLRDPPQSSV